MNRPFEFHFPISQVLRFTVAVALLPVGSGCALIPLATLGTIFDIAGTAATTGPAVYKMGKLDTVLMADYANVQHAVWLAAADLRLQIFGDIKISKTADIRKIEMRDDLKEKIAVTVERRTPALCRCRIDVGLFGSEPTARLLLSRIESHLPTATTAPGPAAKD